MIEVASQQQMKQTNTKSVFRLIQSNKSISRAAIAKMTKLSPTSISTIVGDLILKGWVTEKSTIKGTGAGRKAINLEINSISKYTVGIELSHEGILGTIFNLKNEPLLTLNEHFCAERKLEEEIPAVISNVLHKLIKSDRAKGRELIGGCIGVPAVLDAEKKSIVFSSPFNIKNINLIDRLHREFDFPIFIENETLLSAALERDILEEKRSPFIYLSINEGLGVSVIMNQQYLQGVNGLFLELGHMSLDINGPECSCGNHGCFELHVSIPALVGKVKEYLHRYPDSYVLEHCRNDMERIDETSVAYALKRNDPLAKLVVQDIGANLGRGIVNLIHIFNPEMVVIGGRLSVLGDELLQQAQKQIGERAIKAFADRCTIALAASKGSGISIGGAIYALNKVVDEQFC